ncbi:hypothetical protein DENSPDRAFT_841181 [Dentipellis sp. KUC8613]|nr:hypothetical protein DENSPDRAFT_841181 [Dentipellis sp. KUC8613]
MPQASQMADTDTALAAAATPHILTEPLNSSNTADGQGQHCGTGDNVTIESKIHYNRVYTVCRFPAEILEYIFSSAITDQPSAKPSSASLEHGDSLPLLALVTHVCSHWRAICLKAPRLWTGISDHLPTKWRLEFMRRSGSAPLRIRLRSSIPKALQEEILSHLHHVEVLHLVRLESRACHFIERIWALSAPVLTELHLGFDYFFPSHSPFAWPTSNCDFAPRLQVLRIYSAAGEYTLPCLGAAETLTRFDADLKLDLSKVLQSLRRHSQITFFRSSVIDSAAGVHGAPHPSLITEPAIIFLPQLRTLFIRLKSDSFSDRLAFLRHVKAPSLRRLMMKPLYEEDLDGWHVPVQVDAIGSRLNLVKLFTPHLLTMRDNIGPLRSFSLTMNSGDGIDFVGSVDLTPPRVETEYCDSEYRDIGRQEEERLPQLFLRTNWNKTEPASNTARFLKTACHSWPLSDVRVLLVDSLGVPFSANEWRAIFGAQFSQVTELHFFDTLPSPSLLQACTPGGLPTSPDVHESQMVPFLFPLLKKIVIDCSNGLSLPMNETVKQHVFAAIMVLAINRMEGNSPVAFEIHGCQGLQLPTAWLRDVAEVSVLEGRFM